MSSHQFTCKTCSLTYTTKNSLYRHYAIFPLHKPEAVNIEKAEDAVKTLFRRLGEYHRAARIREALRKMTQQEMESMEDTPLYPKTMKEVNFDKKVDYWRGKLNEIEVAPFNHDNWSII